MSDAVPTLRLVPPPEDPGTGAPAIDPPPVADPAPSAEVAPVPGRDLGPEDVGPGASVAQLAYAGLRRHARSFLDNESGTLLGLDPEALHDMRVAGRRMRAAFALFAPFLPKRAASLRAELGRVGRILGPVRDLDVQLGQLASWRAEAGPAETAAFDAIERVLAKRREVARRRLLRALDGPRYARFKGRLETFLRRGPSARPAIARRPALLMAPELIGRRYRAVRKLGDGLTAESPAADFHALRIRAKRLRYALELHHPLYDGEVAAMIESLTALQDLLGEHQDAVVATAHLEEMAGAARRGMPPRALFLMGSIAGRYAGRAQELRAAFPKTYRQIRGRRWRALKAALASAAPPFAAGTPR